MDFGNIIKYGIMLLVICLLLFFIAIFILPTSGLSASFLSFLPAGISGGLLLLCLIPCGLFILLLYMAYNTSMQLKSSF